LDFDNVRRHWFADSRTATHVWNGVNLLFPGGERFFVRSVRHYLDRLSPELQAQVKGFCGQEGRHAQAHERLFATLRAQGFDVDSIVEPFERIAFQYLEKIAPAALCLSITVAAEHFTALMAEGSLVVAV
jgi:predicted metal-dependent hydrolase